MTDNTINNDMTIGGANGTLLAGRYRVVRQLGQGGMGSVWLAEDTKLDGFKVAIKMLPSVLVNNKRAYAQVKAEALVSLKLSHPNIVTVRAFEEEGGSPFLVMDYIDGQTLDDYLAEKGKLTEDETVKLLKPVAAALDYAHSQGVVHRDVKPGNVMIRKDGTPFVLDFGIAREIQETMTRVTGKLSSGTLMYMSPEQLNGAVPKPAQDVYSFAAMAYECLKGVPPFSRGQIEYQIVNNKPEPLGPQFANCGPGVMAGLEKLPENRPASCAAVLAPSRGNGGGRSPRSTPASQQEAPRSPARAAGGKGLVVGLIVALALAGAGAYHYISVKNVERRRLSEAQVTFERALTSLKSCEEKLGAISREDGFGSRIDEIAEKIPLRSALKNAPSFLSAAECCTGLEKGCRQLLTADELRIQAKTIRDAAQQARQKARGQCASQEAKQTWQAAESAYEQGRREFSQFDFEKAVQSFTLSGQHYEKAASEAAAAREERQKAELARQEQKAQEDEFRKKKEKEIADLIAECETAKRSADAVDAKSVFVMRYSEAQRMMDEALPLMEARNFGQAINCAQSAKGQFVALRADVIGLALDEAKRHKSAGRWEDCLTPAKKVLRWDEWNAEAAALKAEAERNLVPTLRVVAKIGDREVPATATFDGKPLKSPWVWDKNVRAGSRVPSSDIVVEYTEGYKRYVGTMKSVTVDWKGPKVITVALTEYKEPKPGEEREFELADGVKMKFCWCPPGSFDMGSPSSEEDRSIDETQHRVKLTQGFWMGKYEVKQHQWESVMGSNPSGFKGDDRPVERVSWDDCQEFICKINAAGQVTVSLPTEAQWEYACRAGTTTPFNFGLTLNGDKANCDGNYPYGTSTRGRRRETTSDVGSYAPNAWGLHDMHGNVWEWCSDWYGNYTGDATDPIGPASGTYRVFRGGSWSNFAWRCRSANRAGSVPGYRISILGLRLVCSAGPRR